MSFVYPGFLFALSVVAVPIIIHLIQLRKYKRIYFSNVRFLRAIQEDQRQSNKLKHLLVLLSRILAIIFLVLAFAQPYIPVNEKKVVTGENYVSVYVDNSFSMERQGKDGTLLDEAKRKAKEIALAYRTNDHFQLLGNEFSGNQQRWLSRDMFIQQVAELKIRPESRKITEVMKRQASLLNEHKGKSANAFIVSDFQESFFNQNNTSEIDSNIQWQWVMLENDFDENVLIDSVWFYSPLHLPNEKEILLISIRNHSNEDVNSLPYEIILNKEVIGVGNVSVKANEVKIDTFIYKNKSTGYQEGLIQLKDQSVSFDNYYYWSYNVEKNRNAALIQGSNPSAYLKNIFNTEPYFKVSAFDENKVDYQYLQTCDLILLDQLSNFSSGMLDELSKSLDKGATLVLFPNSEKITETNSFMSRFNTAQFEKKNITNSKIEKLNTNSTLLNNVFVDQRGERLELPGVREYLSFSKGSGKTPEHILGLSNNEYILDRYRIGKGNLYAFAMPLDTRSSDLPKHAIVVPMMLRMGSVHHQEQQLAYTIGRDQSVSLKNLNVPDKSKKELTLDAKVLIPEIRYQNGVSHVYVSDQINEAGVYSMKIDGKETAKIAFNNDRSESILKFKTKSELSGLINDEIKIWEPGSSSITNAIQDQNMGNRLWKICLILTLIFLAIEILLLKFGDKIFGNR